MDQLRSLNRQLLLEKEKHMLMIEDGRNKCRILELEMDRKSKEM
jgi:hypothetical protein